MKIVDVSLKPDVRERALKDGFRGLFDEELIMLIIGSGTKGIPVSLMAQKMVDVLRDSDCNDFVKNLLKVKGVGEGKALAVAAAVELGRRSSEHLKAPVADASCIIPFLRNYAVSNKEHFIVITLNGAHEIIEIHVISVGTLNKTLIHPREVFSEAIKENAAAIILCHNHPSGRCEPSDEDIESTKMLINASKIMGIEILDHIIIDYENYFSFVENGVLF